MKKTLFLVISFFVVSLVSAQDSSGADNNVYNSVGISIKPEFPGGMEAFYKYIGDSYRVPNTRGTSGKVIVTFVVEKDGDLSDIKVIKDFGFGTGKEAVRILKKCPKWIPGEQDGKKVRVLYMLPINVKP